MDILKVERIEVTEGRLSVLVRVLEGAPIQTDASMAALALEKYPSLKAHSCLNDEGSRFGDVIDHTSVPHLLEHIIIEEQISDPRVDADTSIVGTTEWLDEAKGLARVQVNFTDDMVALRAFRDALRFLNQVMVG